MCCATHTPMLAFCASMCARKRLVYVILHCVGVGKTCLVMRYLITRLSHPLSSPLIPSHPLSSLRSSANGPSPRSPRPSSKLATAPSRRVSSRPSPSAPDDHAPTRAPFGSDLDSPSPRASPAAPLPAPGACASSVASSPPPPGASSSFRCWSLAPTQRKAGTQTTNEYEYRSSHDKRRCIRSLCISLIMWINNNE